MIYSKAEMIPSSPFKQQRPGNVRARRAGLQGTSIAINLLKAYKNNLTERSDPVYLSQRKRGGKCMSQSINVTDLTNLSGLLLLFLFLPDMAKMGKHPTGAPKFCPDGIRCQNVITLHIDLRFPSL